MFLNYVNVLNTRVSACLVSEQGRYSDAGSIDKVRHPNRLSLLRSSAQCVCAVVLTGGQAGDRIEQSLTLTGRVIVTGRSHLSTTQQSAGLIRPAVTTNKGAQQLG